MLDKGSKKVVFYGLIELALKAPQGDFVRGTLGSSIMIPWLRSGV